MFEARQCREGVSSRSLLPLDAEEDPGVLANLVVVDHPVGPGGFPGRQSQLVQLDLALSHEVVEADVLVVHLHRKDELPELWDVGPLENLLSERDGEGVVSFGNVYVRVGIVCGGDLSLVRGSIGLV